MEIVRGAPPSAASSGGALVGPSSARAWYVVGLLAVLFVFSTVDRTVIALLAAPISQAMTLSDAQMGLVIGMGFSVVYSVAGLPIAHWIDTRTRRTIVTAGVLLWSSMTIGSAFAQDFGSLMVCRAGVAFGEAVLSPAAVSMIADLFVKDKRALPVSIYASIGGIFGSGAFIVGAAVLQLATWLVPISGLAPWQGTLILLGAPGIVLGLLFYLTVREPVRVNAGPTEEKADLAAFGRYLKANWRFYLPFILSVGVYCIFLYSFVAWLPTILLRDHGFALKDAGYVYGSIGIAAGLLGCLVIPPLVTARIERARPLYGVPLTLLGLCLIVPPFMILTPVSGNVVVLLGGVFITTTLGSCYAVMMPLGFQTYAPSRMRARLMAVYLLAANLVGLSVGPVATVFFSGFWTDEANPLAHGVATVGALAAPVLVVCCWSAYRAVGRLTASVS